MQSEQNLTIESIHKGSLAEKSGLQPGDIVLSINSRRLRDPIDFMYYCGDDLLNVEIKRSGQILPIQIVRSNEVELGVEFRPFKVMTCRNNCVFCFVKQLPPGLRKTLYVKDEDYRMSFLYGNYITLSNITKEDKKRIVEQRLSPLYISVHCTDKAVRNRLLGNPKGPDIMKELRFFADNKLRFNAQIVLCPGYNDGKELKQTLSNLYKFYPYVLSIAVVPVGLTSHRNRNLAPVEKEDAESALKIIESFQKRFMKKHGNPIVYGADELYLKAGRPFPPVKEYGELYQLENGVGMVPLFLSQAKKIRIPRNLPQGKRFLTFTGVSFYPFLKKFLDRIREREHIIIDAVPVENTLFGKTVTVAGLLSGRDVIKTILDRTEGYDMMLVPDVVLDMKDRFLDDVTLQDFRDALSVPMRKIDSTPEGIMKGLSEII